MSAPKLYKDFFEKKVFNLNDVVERYKSINTIDSIHTMIRDCKAGGYIGSVKRSLYYIIPQGSAEKGHVVDRYLIAVKLAEDAVISYHSALELHGVAQSVFNRVFIVAGKPVAPLQFQGVAYVGVRGRVDFGTSILRREGVELRVADREKTILDCLDRLKYSGGLEEFLKSIKVFPSVNFGSIRKYLKAYNKTNLYCKAGYIFSILENEWTFPQDLKKEIASKAKEKIYYLCGESKKGTLVKEWNLIVPDNINEIMREA